MILPSLPTTRLIRSSSSAIRSLSSTTSLKVSATLPATPVQSSGRRTEKSPFFKAVKAVKRAVVSMPGWAALGELAFPPLQRSEAAGEVGIPRLMVARRDESGPESETSSEFLDREDASSEFSNPETMFANWIHSTRSLVRRAARVRDGLIDPLISVPSSFSIAFQISQDNLLTQQRSTG